MQKSISLARNLLATLKDTEYTIIRSFDVQPHAFDIDIVALSLTDCEKVLRDASVLHINDSLEVSFNRNGNNIKIDITEESTLRIRLDIVNPEYFQNSEYTLSKTFIIRSIFNHDKINTEQFGTVKVTSNIDGCVYRYFEYLKMYMLREDKIKHVEYLYSTFKEDPSKYEIILKEISNVIKYNGPYVDKNTEHQRNTLSFVISDLLKVTESVKKQGLKKTFSKIYRKLLK